MARRNMKLLGLAAISAVAIYAVGDAVLSPAPISKSPGFVETVLASRAVVAAVRIAVIFAAAFIVVSVVALTAKRQWPTRIGPVQIQEDVSGQEVENGQLRGFLEIAERTIEDLEGDIDSLGEDLGKGAKNDT
jgi:hypothetical protein